MFERITKWLDNKKEHAHDYRKTALQKSKRELKGKFYIIYDKCPVCGHHKAVEKAKGIQCTRCKAWRNFKNG